MATKPCNNQEVCYKASSDSEFDGTKCLNIADIVITGQLRNFQATPPGDTEQKFDFEIEKIEKGKLANVKNMSFQTGCWVGSDLSVPIGDIKKQKGLFFRLYLKKSNKEKSGFRIIHYQNLK